VLQILKAILLHNAQPDIGLSQKDLEDVLEESMDDATLRESAESVREESRDVIWQDDRFVVLDTRLGDTEQWQRYGPAAASTAASWHAPMC
jgi:hypothetical protein